MAINIEFNNQPIREFVGYLNQANEGIQNLQSGGGDLSDGFTDATNEAKKYSDAIKDVTDKGKAFKTNYGDALGRIGEGFASLNPILGGIDKALGTTFSKNLAAVTGFGEAIGGAVRTAGLFGSAMSALIPAVTGASAATATFNATLLANPYVLAGAAIIALIAGIVALAVSTDDATMSEEEMNEAVKKLTESLQEQEKAIDSNRQKLERRYSAEESLIKNEIALLKAQGANAAEIAKKEDEFFKIRIQNSSTKIAEEKQNLLTLLGLGANYMTSTDAQFQFLIKQQVDAKTAFITNQQQRDKTVLELNAKYDAAFNKIIDARAEKQQNEVDREVARLDRQRAATEKAIQANKAAQDKKDKDKQTSDQNAERLRRDTTAAIIKDLDDQTKAIIENNNKQLDILKQNLTDGIITEETFAAEKVLLDRKSNEEIIQLRAGFQITKEQQDIIGAENEMAIRTKNGEEVIRLQRANSDIELGIVRKNGERKIQQTATDEKSRIETFEKEWLQKKIDLIGVEGLKEEELAEAIKQLELDKNKAKLETLQIGSIEYLSLKQQIAEQERAIDKKTKDDAIAAQESAAKFILDTSKTTIDSLTTISDIYFQSRLKQAKGNAKEEEKIARNQFKVNKALQLSTAIITGIGSVMEAYKNGVANPIPLLGQVTGPVYAGIAAAVSAVNIAKISATQFGGGSSSTASAPSPSTPNISGGGTQALTPSLNLFGQANTGNVSAATSNTTVMGPGGQLRVIATVSETEITAVQNRNLNYALNSEL
jgi:hypothetical protein